jgi:hypothetical protein
MAEAGKGHWRWIAMVGLALVAVWLLARESEEDRILARLRQGATAVRVQPRESPEQRRERIARAFEEVFAAEVDATIPDLPKATGPRERLTEAAARLGTGYEQAELLLEQPTVTVGSSGLEASVQTRAVLSGQSASSGLRTDNREVGLRLRKTDGNWQIVALTAAAPSTVEPEARP